LDLPKPTRDPPSDSLRGYRTKHTTIGALHGVVSLQHTPSVVKDLSNPLYQAQIGAIGMARHDNIAGAGRFLSICLRVHQDLIAWLKHWNH
jgi:hypothetical protein